MGTTPTYSLPFLDDGDPPDIPLDGEQSMLAVEAELVRIDAEAVSVRTLAERFKYIVEVTHTVAQLIGTTATAVAFNNEVTDLQAMHDPVTNNSRLVAPIAGRYQIDATYNTGAPAGGSTGVIDSWIRLNGAGEIWRVRQEPLAGANNYVRVGGPVVLAAGGYAEIISLFSGGATNTLAGTARAVMRYVGPA